MPIIQSAIKKLRKDKKRTVANKNKRTVLKKAVKSVRLSATPKNLSASFSFLDKAAKTHLIHKNKAARLKSRLSKLISHPSFASESKTAQSKSRLSKLIKGTVKEVRETRETKKISPKTSRPLVKKVKKTTTKKTTIKKSA